MHVRRGASDRQCWNDPHVMTPTEHTVFVLGAGASVAEAKGFRAKRDRDHPPLDANFFARAARHTDAWRRAPIEAHARTMGQGDLCTTSPTVSLEQYLGRLFFEMNADATTTNVRAYFDLVRWYAAELLTTTNWMIGRSGSIKKLLERELRRPSSISIVTFNHDLLIENALSLLAPRLFGQPWCLKHAYGITPSLTPVAGKGATFDLDCPGDIDSHIPIYKMHGSVNWVFRTLRKYPPPSFASRDRGLALWHNTAITPWVERVNYRKGRKWYLWPLIVPPIYEKHGFIHGELAGVWQSASARLDQATRIVFWGYSFPRADLHARYFFQSAALRNPALTRPILINPDPASEVSLYEVLRPRRVHHYHDVKDFLDDETQGSA
jgi:hypothetical protein